MGPAFTDEELAEIYPHLTPDQRREMEQWHRSRTESYMFGLPVDEGETPPYPSHPLVSD